MIIIGDEGGVVRAFRFSNGSPVFKLPTGSAVYSSAALAFGKVVIGAVNGYLYALG